jgi:hypothetical protein
MKVGRLQDVAKVLGALAGGEAARAVGFGSRKRELRTANSNGLFPSVWPWSGWGHST